MTTPLVADQFKSDPRYASAIQNLLAALADTSQQITEPKSPHPDCRQSYEKTLADFASLRAGALFYPYIASGIGNGALVELADGSIKYDMITGIGVHGLGHAHRSLVEASLHAALTDTIMQGNLQQDAVSMHLMEDLTTLAQKNGADLPHCFLTTTGVMANENALKMIFQKNFPADRLLAFSHCFMGRTLALSHATDKPGGRDGLPQTLNVDYIPFFDANDPEGSTTRAANALTQLIARYPKRHAAMCLELIQGEGGFNVGSKQFFLTLINILKQNNIAVLIDEVQTFGRTTQPFAFQHFELDQHVDLVTIGKLSQVCATLFSDNFKPRPGLVSQTFTGATASIHACRAILKHLHDNNQFGSDGRNTQIHNQFTQRFNAIHAKHPDRIAGPYGCGAMIAFTVFDGSPRTTQLTLQTLFQNGLIVFVAGANPSRVRFLPPMGVIADHDINAVCDILEVSLDQVAEQI